MRLGMKNPIKILKAFITKIYEKLRLLDPRVVEKIIERQRICQECPLNSVKAYELGLYKIPQGRNDLHCSLCGCTISILTRCLTCACSIDEENKKNNENLPVKWLPI